MSRGLGDVYKRQKPVGARPGMVIFTDYKTAFVTPDESLVMSLSVNDAKKT